MVTLSQPCLLRRGPLLNRGDKNPAVVAANQRDVLQQVVPLQGQLLHRLQGLKRADPREGGERRAEGPAHIHTDHTEM